MPAIFGIPPLSFISSPPLSFISSFLQNAASELTATLPFTDSSAQAITDSSAQRSRKFLIDFFPFVARSAEASNIGAVHLLKAWSRSSAFLKPFAAPWIHLPGLLLLQQSMAMEDGEIRVLSSGLFVWIWE